MSVAEWFWKNTYGVTDLADFQARVGPFWPDYLLGPLGPSNATQIQTAWESPLSVPGGMANTLLAAQAVAGWTPPQVLGIGQIGGGYFRTRAQEEQMGQLIVADCFQVAINALAGGREVVNVIGVRNSGGTAAGAAAAVQTAWKVASGPLSTLSSYYALTSFDAMDVGSSNGDIVQVLDTTTGGLAAQSFATAGACALVKWNGGTRSRSSRGRLYFGPIRELDINTDGRTLAAASITTYGTAFTNFRNSLSAAGYPLVILSRKLGTSTTVSSQSVETTIATQRRRIRA